MKSISDYAKEWENNAEKDPYWAVLTAEEGKNRSWDTGKFFATGQYEIETLFRYMKQVGIELNDHGSALDFGCGVGRLSRALKEYFQTVTGIDISKAMVEEAQKCTPSVRFLHNPRDDLQLIPTSSIDFVYSHIVLQHMRPNFQKVYLQEFARVLKPEGVAVIQIPSKRVIRKPIELLKLLVNKALSPNVKKIILEKILKKIDRFEAGFCIEMNCLSEKKVQSIASQAGMDLQHMAYTNSTDPNFAGRLKFLTHAEARKSVKTSPSPYLSCMYFFRKR